MIEKLDSENAEVAIIKGNTPKEGVLEGIEKLGGISKFINEGDQVFIKFNLNLPHGFPTNTNYDVLKDIYIDDLKSIFLDEYPKAEKFLRKNKKLQLKIKKLEAKNKIKISRSISLEDFNKALEIWERMEIRAELKEE